MQDFSKTIVLECPADEVFKAINNVRGWWQGEIEGRTDKLNEEFTYRMETMHYSKQRIIELIPNQKIVWLVIESELSFTENKFEWTGTQIIFEIVQQDNLTHLRLTHQRLVPKFECYNDCTNGWEMLIQQSLFSLITTGEGKNVFNV